MRSKKTQRLGEVAPAVLARADKGHRRHGALAVNAWEQVVGPEISRHTRGYALKQNRELLVFVDSAPWANQLSLMSEELRDRLNAYIGEDAVRSLRFNVSRKVSDAADWSGLMRVAEEFYEPEEATSVPLDEIELAQARQVADAVRDPELREAALRAMVSDLERKKAARTTGAEVGSESASGDGKSGR